VRTAAMNAAEEDLRADIRFLKGLWAEIKSRADAGKGPTLIYHDLNCCRARAPRPGDLRFLRYLGGQRRGITNASCVLPTASSPRWSSGSSSTARKHRFTNSSV